MRRRMERPASPSRIATPGVGWVCHSQRQPRRLVLPLLAAGFRFSSGGGLVSAPPSGLTRPGLTNGTGEGATEPSTGRYASNAGSCQFSPRFVQYSREGTAWTAFRGVLAFPEA